jgi:hypothetical protein
MLKTLFYIAKSTRRRTSAQIAETPITRRSTKRQKLLATPNFVSQSLNSSQYNVASTRKSSGMLLIWKYLCRTLQLA